MPDHGRRRTSSAAAPAKTGRDRKWMNSNIEESRERDFGKFPHGCGYRYSQWLPSITGPVGGVFASRGPWTRRLKIASVCSGAAPCAKIMLNLGVPHEYVFTCDSKKSSFNFIDHNFKIGHHFMDVRELSCGSGRCAMHEPHGVPSCNLSQIVAPGELDLLIAGVSCRPYTRARAGRSAGTCAHQDSDLSDQWLALVALLIPTACIFENVWGITCPESKWDKTTPLQKLVSSIKATLPDYTVSIFGMCGSTWMVMARRRVYMVLMHKRAGSGAVARMKAMVKDTFVMDYLSTIVDWIRLVVADILPAQCVLAIVVS